MAAERVWERCRRAAQALDAAGVPYAVAGGNAVAEWVGRVDEGAVRNTRDVDILIRRDDFAAAKLALENAGFVYHRLLEVDTFLDGPHGKPSEAVHLLFAREKVRDDLEFLTPDVADSERASSFQVASLESLVRMKLMANRDKDRTHLRDLIGVGLIDASWPGRFPPLLAHRLQRLLDDPNG
jgi:hypothetical protein